MNCTGKDCHHQSHDNQSDPADAEIGRLRGIVAAITSPKLDSEFNDEQNHFRGEAADAIEANGWMPPREVSRLKAALAAATKLKDELAHCESGGPSRAMLMVTIASMIEEREAQGKELAAANLRADANLAQAQDIKRQLVEAWKEKDEARAELVAIAALLEVADEMRAGGADAGQPRTTLYAVEGALAVVRDYQDDALEAGVALAKSEADLAALKAQLAACVCLQCGASMDPALALPGDGLAGENALARCAAVLRRIDAECDHADNCILTKEWAQPDDVCDCAVGAAVALVEPLEALLGAAFSGRGRGASHPESPDSCGDPACHCARRSPSLNAPQPPPRCGEGPEVWPLVIESGRWSDAVKADMLERDALGRERYGTPLRAWNGRDAAVDAYQEALDLRVYLEQMRRRLDGLGAGMTQAQVAAAEELQELALVADSAIEQLGAIARAGVVPTLEGKGGGAGRDEWLEKLAKECRNCPGCGNPPCDGCQAGGICDESDCYCGDDRDAYDEDEDGPESKEGA